MSRAEMRINLIRLLLFLLTFPQPILSITCLEVIASIASHTPTNLNDIYSELQKIKENGKTSLGYQPDYSQYIDPLGGGPCASVTGFNVLQGLRVIANEPLLDPKTTILESYEALPILKMGRVTNSQFADLFNHYQKYLPNHTIETTNESFDATKLKASPNEIKIVTFSVINNGVFLGRHFVILKRHGEGNSLIVVDPNNPPKEHTYPFQEAESTSLNGTVTKLIPHPKSTWAGYDLTVDTVFSVKISPR